MRISRRLSAGVSGFVLSLLAACGGGGDSAAPAAPTALPAALSISAPVTAELLSAQRFSSDLAPAGTGLTVTWDFGDGQSSTESQPSHAYAAAGNYTVTLTVRNEAGSTRSASTTLSVGRYARLAGSICSGAKSTGWCWQQPRPTGNAVNDVSFVDASTGWAVGDAGQILKSTDAGASWMVQRSGVSTRLTQVRFANTQAGWALGERNTLLRTVDGGAIWTQQASGIAGDSYYNALGGLTVLDAKRAVLTSYYSASRYTVDGGDTWNALNVSTSAITPAGVLWTLNGYSISKSSDFGKTTTTTNLSASGQGYLSQLLFSDDLHGWAIGNDYVNYSYRQIFWRTADGGSTWQRVLPSANVALSSPNYIKFFGAGDGWMSTYSGVYRSADGGTTWSAVAPPTDYPAYYGFSNIVAADANTAWFSASQGFYLTRDGGKSWTLIKVDGEAASAYSSTTSLQLIGGTSLLLRYGERTYRSADNGKTFQRIFGSDPADALSDLSALWFFDGAKGLAYSTSGRIYDTQDGGATWNAKALTAQYAYGSSRFQFNGSDKGWLLGGGNAVFRTLDSGKSWFAPVSALVLPQLADFHFADANTGWALGRNGDIYRSDDAGSSWALQLNVPYTLNALRFTSSSVGVVVGSGGIVARTADGGLHWNLRAAGTTQALRRVTFSGANTGWAVGDAGTLLKSADAGLSWAVIPLATTAALNDIGFVDAQNGWIVGNGGVVLNTSDGGSTWRLQNSGSSRTLNAMFFVDKFTGWLVGASGSILATATGGR